MKKVLSLVLILALVMGSFSMAFADTAGSALTDIEASANADAIVVVNDLGIVTGYPDGTFKGTNPVTRAEFAAMITRALAVPESALAGFTAAGFTDVASDYWAVKYLGYCVSKGIMNGYGDGTVRPNATITVNEAITMMCRAIGYVNEAKELVGTWPANYISLAQSLDLYTDLAAVGTIDRQNAAQLIYNGLTTPLKYIDNEGATADVSGKGTMLALLGGHEVVENEDGVATGTKTFVLTTTDADKAIINIREYVGQNVKAFANSKGQIIAIEVLSTTLEGEFDAAGDNFTVDDVDYKVSNKVGDYTVTNGVSAEAFAYGTPGLSTTLAVDVTGKTITKIYSRIDWTVSATIEVDEDTMNLEKATFGDYKFATNKSLEIDEDAFVLLGVDKLTDIKEKSIAQIYAIAGNYITKLEIGTETVTGTVTKERIDSDDNHHYTINGSEYMMYDYSDVRNVGDEGTARLTYTGMIYDWDAVDAAADNYAIVVGEYKPVGRASTIVLFDKEGNEKEYEVTSDVTPATLNLVDDAGNVNAGGSVGKLVTFALNSSGKIKELNVITPVTATAKATAGGKLFNDIRVADGVVVFVNDAGDYSIGKAADIQQDENITVQYRVNDNKIVAMIVNEADMGNKDDTYGIVTKNSSTGANAKGDTVKLLDVIINGAVQKDVLTDSSSFSSTVSGSNNALYVIEMDEEGVITSVTGHGLTAGTEVVGTGYASCTTVTAIDASKDLVTYDNAKSYPVADDVVIYVWDTDDLKWVVKTALSSIKNKQAVLYDTDEDGIFDIILAGR